MAAPAPVPPDPNAGSKWVPSDFLYVIASAVGLIGAPVAGYFLDHPLIGIAIGPVTTFLFWAASYAANKGD